MTAADLDPCTGQVDADDAGVATVTALRGRLAVAGPRRLGEPDRGAMLAHLQRLSDDDRRLRFLQTTTDDMLRAYVERIAFDQVPCFGFFDAAGALVALTEALPCGARARRTLEAAFTTDAPWRRAGLAHALFATMARLLVPAEADEIVLHCDARNRPMRALLQRVGAELDVDGREVTAVWRPTAPAAPR